MSFNPFLLKSEEYPLATIQKKADAMAEAGQKIINLTIGDPKDDTYAKVREDVSKSMLEVTHSSYPKLKGDPSFLEAVSKWVNRTYQVHVDPVKHILSCNGTKEAIFHFPLLLDLSQKEIWIPDLSYPVYQSTAEILGIPFRTLAISKASNFLPKLEDIPDSEWKKCGLFWINSPHNPTTAVADKNYLDKLLSLAKKHNFVVCSDECYNEIFYEEMPASCLEFPESQHWVVFKSLSKRSHMTGYRIGAVISKNEKLIKLFEKLRLPMGLGTPTFIQKAAVSAWDDEEHVLNNRLRYQARRDKIKPLLEKLGFSVFGATSGFYFWISHSKLKTSHEICEFFIKLGILITPGTAFGKAGEGYARMVYCVLDQSIEEVVKLLESAKHP